MDIIKFKSIKRRTVIVHVLIWAVIILLPFIFSSENQNNRDRDEIAFRNLNTATLFFWMGSFYLNAWILIPSFIYTKKYFLYIFSLLVLFCIIMGLHGTLFVFFIAGHHFNFFRSSAHNLIPFIFTITISTTYKILLDKIRTDALAKERQQENLRSELSFLRSQISPHFLFNVLNSIVAMVRLKSEELEPTVIKLSSLLQYMLYDTDEEKVLLKNEVEYLQSYIDLQKMRFGSKLNLDVHFDVRDEWQSIEPMLLIPFVENAFKHGTGMQKNPEIHVSLTVKNGMLDFQVKNKFVPSDKSKDKTSGIGLANIKRRLDLLYENTHWLVMDQSDDCFTVSLKMNLGK
jgi:two-component system, LytTR family, sensor kinase